MSPAGRPPLGEERKDVVLKVMLSQEQRGAVDAAAAAGGMRTSTWARDVLLAAAAEIAASQAKPAGKNKAANGTRTPTKKSQ